MADYENQHWIPQCYTKAWIDPAIKSQSAVHRYTSDGRYLDYRPTKRVFAERDLYTINHPAGVRDLRMEHWFQKLESRYSRIIRRLEKRELIDGKDRLALAYFTAAMRNRSPAARDHWDEFLALLIKKGDAMAAAFQRASPAEKRRMSTMSLRSEGESLNLDEIKLSRSGGFGTWLPTHLAIEADLLSQMTLTVVAVESPDFFITSDSPVVWWDGSEGSKPFSRPLGLGMRNIEVSLPLSPRSCLLFTHGGYKAGYSHAAPEGVDEINKRTLFHTQETFISHSSSIEVKFRKRFDR